MNREQWLNDFAGKLVPWFQQSADVVIPAGLRVGCGWPSSRALSKKKKRIGECWSPECSASGVHEVFVSPFVADPIEVGEVLVHEIVHAIVGVQEKHGKAFGKLARKVGLEGKMTSTFASGELRVELEAIVGQLGAYPHASLESKVTTVKKQGTRMLKMSCIACGYTVRAAKKWLDRGLPSCPCNGSKFEAEEGIE